VSDSAVGLGRSRLPRVRLVLPLESVPNFSEGRDLRTIGAIGDALGSFARLLDVHADEDHNRSVFTIVGDDDALVDALLAAVRVAVERIDLREHEGVHPRVGAADVVPFVPLRPDDFPRARAAAERFARLAADELDIPVFLYAPPGRGPAFYRRGGTDGLQRRVGEGELTPDFGPLQLHQTAGGVIAGARAPLIAFNVNLRGTLEAAREIAGIVRERGGGFRGVRALGVELRRAGLVQVSMNVEDWEASPLIEIVARIAVEAGPRGAEVVGSEVVGLMPAGAAAAAAGAALRIDGFDASRVLEVRLLDD
jgi:glutamate formiminotransferase